MRPAPFLLSLLLALSFIPASAQYFGRNKPKYRDFDFRIFETPHFNIYYYDLDSARIALYASWFEWWYDHHSQLLGEQFVSRNPVILYNNHGEFQQNFVISGNVDAGTGGVTEGLRNRIVLPLAITNDQTFHVIGHELVHAFQYNMILRGDSTSTESLQNYPLWIIEGLAEYLSKGSVDVQTAMWMRDAVLRGKLPDLEKMDRPEYFPYRFGHAFWSFFSSLFGNARIKPFFVSVGQYGLATACLENLGIPIDTLNSAWQRTLSSQYSGQFAESGQSGKEILSSSNAGRMNLSPSISPNGRYLCFLSEKDLFTTDLFLASAQDGKILRKLFSQAREGHIDQLNSLESAGTWSPDSRRFAFPAFKRGRSVLVIKDVETGKTQRELQFANLPYFIQPAWSPDGKSIVVTGTHRGQTDLYLIDLKTKKATRLTENSASEIHPEWSPDGKILAFSTDAPAWQQGQGSGYWPFSLALLDPSDRSIRYPTQFDGANHFNPQYDASGNLLFLSDRNGAHTLYRLDSDSAQLSQLTLSSGGIMGVSAYAPAFSAAGKRDRIVYTQFRQNSFGIHQISTEKLLSIPVGRDAVDRSAAYLPMDTEAPLLFPDTSSRLKAALPSTSADSFNIRPYRARFGLSYVGASGGAGYGGNYLSSGIGLSGGVDMLFTDILGSHQLYTGLALNGEIYDVAAVASYLNRSWSLPWGVTLQHLPTRYFNYTPGFVRQNFVDENGNVFSAYTDTTLLLRIFEEEMSGVVHYPLSVTQRFEFGAGSSYRFFRLDQIIDFYDDINKFFYLGGQKEKLKAGDAVQVGPYTIEKGWLSNVNAAWVGDNAYFGLTAPMVGYRYRVGVETYFGQYDFSAMTIDGRKYFWMKPFALAFRFMHYARYGRDANRFYPILIGQYGLIHGYDFDHLEDLRQRYGIEYEQISGSKIGLASVEFRLPLTGPDRFALLNAPFLPIELNVFIDGGMAWDDWADFSSDIDFLKPKPVFSTGLGFRINLFGALVLEPYWAWPLRSNSRAQFGFNFIPGW
ncbi:MAG: PD40 domain-containing protein [Saprospiraceae bacterium]|nr:PD40 domain-containing protein [Saprospiraceae bacterium]MBP9210468.1 PD40 domain-containing protein [Saprospiraceae bacterium]